MSGDAGAISWLVVRSGHLLSVAFFMGGALCAAFVKVRAEKTGDVNEMRCGLELANEISSRITGPCAAVVTASGLLMASFLGWAVFRATWLQLLLVAWVASAGVAMTILAPSLRALQTHLNQGTADRAYWQKSRAWNLVAFGLVAFNVGNFLLATIRPS